MTVPTSVAAIGRTFNTASSHRPRSSLTTSRQNRLSTSVWKTRHSNWSGRMSTATGLEPPKLDSKLRLPRL